jgi:REP element-mobilizing transposase RayT
MVAHGASRGWETACSTSPGGAAHVAHSFSKLLYHVIFSTKNREPWLEAALKPGLFAYMAGIISELRGKALIINGPADHVHLLLSLPASLAVADAIRVLKTNSSKWVHETWPDRCAFGWQTGYGVFSVSRSNREQVWRYIADQEKHHRKGTFQEEFVALLKKHDIEYDEQYLWE